MCDTMIAMNTVTEDGSVIFGKNSDREANEAQNVTFVPASIHPGKSTVACTYIEIPQVEKTNAAILSRPFWMFGAEMGVNDQGVVIGNEAVFTREKYMKQGLLTGMDMLRLALERSKSAEEAQSIIVGLLEKFGQGGNCSMDGKLYYHNSFIIADAESAFVLETADRMWVSKKVIDVATISNCLTIDDTYDAHSQGIDEYAVSKGYIKSGHVDFARDFSDRLITFFAGGKVRQSCSLLRMERNKGSVSTKGMMAMLRDHNSEGEYVIGKKPMKRICMHAGGLVSSQSTGSMVVKMKKGYLPLIYITGTAAPCLSLFKPLTLKRGQKSFKANSYSKPGKNSEIDIFGNADKKYDPDKLWWIGEEIHRRIIPNYAKTAGSWIGRIRPEEDLMHGRVEKAWKTKNADKFVKTCEVENERLLRVYKELVSEYISLYKSPVKKISFVAQMQWKCNSKKAGLVI